MSQVIEKSTNGKECAYIGCMSKKTHWHRVGLSSLVQLDYCVCEEHGKLLDEGQR